MLLAAADQLRDFAASRGGIGAFKGLPQQESKGPGNHCGIDERMHLRVKDLDATSSPAASCQIVPEHHPSSWHCVRGCHRPYACGAEDVKQPVPSRQC